MSYVCEDGFTETVLLKDFRRGKLVWKVDWPMRWAYEGVVFEPSGVDHQSPGVVVRRRQPARPGDLRRASRRSARCTRSSGSAAWRR